MPKALGFDWSLRSINSCSASGTIAEAARRRLPQMVWAYLDGGADDLVALYDNEAAFQRWALSPQTLTGAGTPELSTNIAGVTLDLPVLLVPPV